MQRYQVTGPRVVLDHQPGEVFEADLDPVQAQRLIAAGHLTPLARLPESTLDDGSADRAEEEHDG
jgi:hypothetical protein